MKNLIEYIYEERLTKENTNESETVKQTKQNVEFFDKLFNNLSTKLEKKNKRSNDGERVQYSLNDKIQQKKLYNALIKTMVDSINVEEKLKKEFKVKDGHDLARFLWKNAKFFSKVTSIGIVIKNFDEREIMANYRKFKSSAKYQDGEPFNPEEFDPTLDGSEGYRTLVIYDVNDPGNLDSVLSYKLYGTRGYKDVEHDVNNFKTNWRINTDLTYYDARPILAKNYIKKTPDQLRKIEIESNDDLLEIE